MEIRDETLMELYATGDIAAFQELFRRYERRAYSFFWKRTRSEDRTADLFQDLFLRVHRFRATYRSEFKFTSWFFQVADNVFMDHLRHHFRLREEPIDDCKELSVPASAEWRACQREAVEFALAGLSDEQTRVLVAAKVEGFEYPEVAEALGKSVDAVKQIASRTLRRLRGAAPVETARAYDARVRKG